MKFRGISDRLASISFIRYLSGLVERPLDVEDTL